MATGSEKNLSAVLSYALPLAPSVGYISRIGLIDRTEAIDLATLPVATTLDLLGTVAEGLGKVAGDSKAGTILIAASSSLSFLSSTVESTPDAASHVINGAVSAESWTRDLLRRAWPISKDDSSNE